MDLSPLVAICAAIVATASILVGAVLGLDRHRQKDAVRRHDDARKLDEVWQHFAPPAPGESRLNLPTQLSLLSVEVAKAVQIGEQANETAERTSADLRAHSIEEREQALERTEVMRGLTGELVALRSDMKEVRDARNPAA